MDIFLVHAPLEQKVQKVSASVSGGEGSEMHTPMTSMRRTMLGWHRFLMMLISETTSRSSGMLLYAVPVPEAELRPDRERRGRRGRCE